MAQHKFARLTPKQLRVLTLIRDYQRKHGYSPTMQELAETLHITKVTVFEHVTGLEKKGLLRRSRHRARSLELTEHGRAAFPDESRSTLPLVGHIAAGSPIEAVENRVRIEVRDNGPGFQKSRPNLSAFLACHSSASRSRPANRVFCVTAML